MEGHESGIDIRRDDGTLDVALNWIARNGEVHFTVEVNSMYGLAKTIVDFTPEQAAEIAGAFKEAAWQAKAPLVTFPRPAGVLPQPGTGWTREDVGHVLGERD